MYTILLYSFSWEAVLRNKLGGRNQFRRSNILFIDDNSCDPQATGHYKLEPSNECM